MKKTLLLVNDEEMYFFPYICESKNFDVRSYYKKRNSFINNFFFKLLRKFKSKKISIYCCDWKKNIDEYDKVVLFDYGYTDAVCKYINSMGKHTILFFWNTIDDSRIPLLYSEFPIEKASYDNEDSTKYDLKFVDTFYTKCAQINKQTKKESDVYFLAKRKNRSMEIDEASKLLHKENLNLDFQVVGESEMLRPYSYNLKKITSTSSLLDIVDSEQNGLTLRVMESLFYNIKLITNNEKISKWEFYNPSMHYILGEKRKIKDFLSSKVEEVNTCGIEYYDIEEWLGRVITG